jgi:four helix bundle protein
LESSPIRSYKDLEVYQRSLSILVPVHLELRKFPEYEQRELCSQMRRASKSVPINIGEGYGKKRSAKDFKTYLDRAMGSANEMVVCLEISKLLGYMTAEKSAKLAAEYETIGKQLNKLIQRWE